MRRVWGDAGGVGLPGIGAGGLAMNGGNGIDGETLLAWLDPVEMGGTLLLEAVGVTLVGRQHRHLGGIFCHASRRRRCIAGLQATAQQGTGAVTLQPIVQGRPRRSAFTLNPRTNTHCGYACIARSANRSRSHLLLLRRFGPIAAGGRVSSRRARSRWRSRSLSTALEQLR